MQVATKITVVEDDASIRQMYLYKLQSSGYDVSVAKNGREGLQVIEQNRPEIILLDIMMPEMNGDEMLTKLREYDWAANIRVVILTNISKTEAPHMLRFLNVDRYIVKAHSTPKDVVNVVEEILGKTTTKTV